MGAMSRDDVAEAARRVVATIDEFGLPWTRGSAESFFARTTEVHLGLTLPGLARREVESAIDLKNLVALWVYVVDDEIDCRGSREILDGSILALLGEGVGASDRGLAASAAMGYLLMLAILGHPVARLARRPEALAADLWHIAGGFMNEYLSNTDNTIANSREYALSTGGSGSNCMAHMLDIDCTLRPISVDEYRPLRVAYQYMGDALRLAGDVGSARREWDCEGRHLNWLYLSALEEGLFASGTTRVAQTSFDEAFEYLGPLAERLRAQAARHLEVAGQLIAGVHGVDASRPLETATSLVDRWFEEDLLAGAT